MPEVSMGQDKAAMFAGNFFAAVAIKGRKKQQTKTFCGQKWPVWDPLYEPKIPSKKFMWVPFVHPFPGNEAHHFFWGPKSGGLGGGQKVYVENVYVFFLSACDELCNDRI